jgi:hypothetical protein
LSCPVGVGPPEAALQVKDRVGACDHVSVRSHARLVGDGLCDGDRGVGSKGGSNDDRGSGGAAITAGAQHEQAVVRAEAAGEVNDVADVLVGWRAAVRRVARVVEAQGGDV